MIRRVAIAATVALALLVPAAAAHPLGNFTVNQYTRLDLWRTDVSIRYVLDMAEIPTFQDKPRIDADPVAYADQRVGLRTGTRRKRDAGSGLDRRLSSLAPTRGPVLLRSLRRCPSRKLESATGRWAAAEASSLPDRRERPARLRRRAGIVASGSDGMSCPPQGCAQPVRLDYCHRCQSPGAHPLVL